MIRYQEVTIIYEIHFYALRNSLQYLLRLVIVFPKDQLAYESYRFIVFHHIARNRITATAS